MQPIHFVIKLSLSTLNQQCLGRIEMGLPLEPHREKTGIWLMRKQRRRSASQ